MLKLKLAKGSKRLLLIMPVVALLIIASGYLHYRGINRSEDPRVLQARTKFSQYNRLMRENRFAQALALLNDIEMVYRNTPGYENGFELGVIENNRASVHLVQAETERLSQKQPSAELVQIHLKTARAHTLSALKLYNQCQVVFATLDRKQIVQQIRPYFDPQTPAFEGLNLEKIVAKRADDMLTAMAEMPRRLSVSYTNLGVIARYDGDHNAAKQHYEKALSLWEHNHVARNNLNILLGRPAENPSVIQKLFPPSKKLQ